MNYPFKHKPNGPNGHKPKTWTRPSSIAGLWNVPQILQFTENVFLTKKKKNHIFQRHVKFLKSVVSIKATLFYFWEQQRPFRKGWYQRNLVSESQTAAKKQYLSTLTINDEKTVGKSPPHTPSFKIICSSAIILWLCMTQLSFQSSIVIFVVAVKHKTLHADPRRYTLCPVGQCFPLTC